MLPGKEKSFPDHLNSQVPVIMKQYEIPGTVIALITDGRIAWQKAYGYADTSTKRKMETGSVCMAHSISKSVTAWGVMKLIQDGKIDPDKPVAAYLKKSRLPDSDPRLKSITTKQLLSNSSGLGLGTIGVHYEPGEKRPGLAESLFPELETEAEPDTTFIYSNLGFNLLELLVEEVTGQDFGTYMEENVLKPLGMTHSGFNYTSKQFPHVPMGYTLGGKPVPVYLYAGKASGGLFATAGDIARFVTAGMSCCNTRGRAVLQKESIDRLYHQQIKISGLFSLVFKSYGYGHFIEILPNGMKAVSHGGQGLGWMTHFHFVPETGDGIVILTNSQRSWPMFSRILDSWSNHYLKTSVGMGMISQAQVILRVFLGVIIILSLYLISRMAVLVRKQERSFDLSFSKITRARITALTLSASVYGILIWSLIQDYLFITSIFPIAATWLGYTSLLFATVLMSYGLFVPAKGEG